MENIHQITKAVGSGIAEVWLKQKNKRIDTAYDYKIPTDLSEKAVPGVRVVVPFGNGSRLLEGFILVVKSKSTYSEELKPILSVIDDAPVLTDVQCALCRWVHRYYGALFYEALMLFAAPVKVVRRQKKNRDGDAELYFEAYRPKRLPVMTSPEVTAQNDIEELFPLPSQPETDRIRDAFRSGMPCFYENISQMARFEVYCRLAEETMQHQGQAVILVPEVFSLNSLKSAFYTFFGSSGKIYTGELKPAERYAVFQEVRSGKVGVVMGTRAALFLPYVRLDLIMMDEPDDSAYFARSMPHYDTLRVVQEYCRICGAKLLLGGTVLPLQIYNGIRLQHIRYIKNERSFFPTVEIVDMQSEMRRGNLNFISGLLKQRMEETVLQGKKVLLMLNRRGAASYMLCRQCGYVEKCRQCGISLKPHTDGKLRCAYCGEIRTIQERCPVCHSVCFKPVGLGVEKAAAFLKRRYPNWRILEMDAQILADAERLTAVRSQLDTGQWDVVIGTRVLPKEWHFKSVGLAASLLMDEALNHGDYNDSEKAVLLFQRFFALSEQYAVGQTYEPEHEVIEVISGSDCRTFYESELTYRKMMHYPPFCHLVVFSVMDPSETQAASDAAALYRRLAGFSDKIPPEQFFQTYRPVLAGIQPKTGRIRYKIMLKVSQIALFHQMLTILITAGEIEKLKSKVAIAIDPAAAV